MMRLPRLEHSWWAWALFALAIGGSAADPPPLFVEVKARSITPGEPLRIVVESVEPLDSLEGTFLDETLFLTCGARSGRTERWFGWAMIALDQPAGTALLTLRGTTRAGNPVAAGRTLTIEAKVFPREELKVAPRYVEPPPDVELRLARERRRLTEIYATRRPENSQPRPFLRPVPGAPTSVFGTRRIYNGEPRSPHPGLDLQARTGTEVQASGAGEVVLAHELYYSGNTVILDHGGGLFTLYAHLSKLRVDRGDRVVAGQIVGLAGATGRVTGPHLHWGAKIGSRPFDPTALLDETLFR